MFYVLLACFGCLSGVTAVLFGFGGGFVVVPLMYRLLMARHAGDVIGESAMHIAVATSTCVMIVNALAATRKHHRAGQLIRRYLWPFGGFIALGAILGAAAATWINGEIIRYAFIAYLSLPVALAGTVTYMTLAGFTGTDFGPWFIGYVDVLAFVVLTLGALLGIRLSTPWIGRIPDRFHAWVYIALLGIVMLGISIQ